MKKTTKIWLIVTGSLLALGMVVMLIGFAMAGFSVRNLNANSAERLPRTEKTYSAQGEVTSLCIDLARDNILLRQGDGDRVQLRYYESEQELVRLDEIGGTLTLTTSQPIIPQFFKWSLFDNIPLINVRDLLTSPPVEIVLPKDYAGKVTLQATHGSVEVTPIMAQELSIHASYGAVWLSDAHIDGPVLLKTSFGNIHLNGIVAKSLTANNSNGKTTIDNAVIDGILYAENSFGANVLTTIEAKGLTLRNNNGAIRLDDAHVDALDVQGTFGAISVTNSAIKGDALLRNANGAIMLSDMSLTGLLGVDSSFGTIRFMRLQCRDIDAQSNNGAIILNKVDARSLYIRSTFGGVTGSLIGEESEYSIQASTEFGKNLLRSTEREGAQRKLDVSTQNGSIDIEFVGAD